MRAKGGGIEIDPAATHPFHTVRLSAENYSLRHSPDHKWYYYSRQTKDECLVFKVYDKKEDGPRFVFHTAFDDPHTPASSPP